MSTIKFSSTVKPTSFSLHPETVARLRLASDRLSRKFDKRISMSKIVERAAHLLMDEYDIRKISRVSSAAQDRVKTHKRMAASKSRSRRN